MFDPNLGKTFFPGSRKELYIEGISLLEIAGDKRIKLSMTMPLSDGKLVGLPAWLGDVIDRAGKQGSLEASTKFAHNIEEMTLYVHHLEDKKPKLTLPNCRLKAFAINRELSDAPQTGDEPAVLSLAFVAHVPANLEAWDWFYGYIHKSIFVRFEATQPSLTDLPQKGQMTLDDHELAGAGKR